MPAELMQDIKTVLLEQERLFTKLYKTAEEYEAIDFDESGLYEASEARSFRHWKRLTTKLAEAINEIERIEQVKVEPCKTPADRIVVFAIHHSTGEETMATRFEIDYARKGEISILQLS